jgi:hypothetical protein
MLTQWTGPKGDLKTALHALNNTAGIILANWFVVRDQLPAGDPAAADIDEAGRRLVDQLAALAKAIEAVEVSAPGPTEG